MVEPKNQHNTPENQPMRPQAWGPIPPTDDIERFALDNEGMTRKEAAAALNRLQYVRHLYETSEDTALTPDERDEAASDIRALEITSASILYPHMEADRINREVEQRQE